MNIFLSCFNKSLLKILMLVCFLWTAAYADNTSSTEAASQFNPVEANQMLDRLTIKLSIQALNATNLQHAVDTLTNYQTQAKQCVVTSNNRLSDIEKQLQAIGVNGTPSAKGLSADEQYLTAKKNQLTQQLAECRLFVIRSQETMNAFSKTIEHLTATQLLSANAPIWTYLKASSQVFSQLPSRLDASVFGVQSGLIYLNIASGFALLGLVVCALFLGIHVKSKLKLYCNRLSLLSPLPKIRLAFFSVLQSYVVSLFVAVAIILFASVIALLSKDLTYFTAISYTYLILLLFLAGARFFFYPPKPAVGFSRLPTIVAKRLRRRITSLALLSFIGLTVYILFQDQPLPTEVIYTARSIFVSILAINLISLVWLVTQGVQWFQSHLVVKLVFNTILSISLLVTLVAEIFGYYNLSHYVLLGIALTVLYSFMALMLHKFLLATLANLTTVGHPWQKALHDRLGLVDGKAPLEFLWLKIAINFAIGCALLMALTKVWGLSASSYVRLKDIILHGFVLAKLQMTPLRIILGLLVLALLSLIVRVLRQRLVSQVMTEQERGNREALAAIFGYMGFGLALLFSLLIAGINFTGFAFIAGALSVGIGFGLQNIVNNFVSGIILLIERPIKPGDRIIVGQTEGYVKKISIRSTRILTTDKADVIVPNSELISGQVTNLMFQDYEFRIKLAVGVMYGCDTALVKKLLLEVADSHPGVVKQAPSLPGVFFKQFGESSLQFELSCVIADVNERGQIISELNFAIEKTLREHQIEIPYPQRDIHIKSWPPVATQQTFNGQ